MSKIKLKKKNKLQPDNNKLLLPELPFYGIGGSIYRIEEAPESYYKVIYNANGTINPQKIPVPKNKNKNLNYILKDYCEDLKKYLEKFENQYLEYENNNNTKILSNKQFYILAITTSLATIASIPFIFQTSFIGLLFTTISTLSLYIVCDIHKKDIQKEKARTNFKKQYKNHQRNLVNYRSGNLMNETKTIETIYTKINEVDKSYLKILPKIKKLTKEVLKEAA